MRVIIAGIIGGIAMFFWGAVAHMVLPIGEMGMKTPVEQQATLASIAQTATGGQGVYMYPSLEAEKWGDEAAMKAFTDANKGSAYAFVVYQPGGNPVNESMTPNLIKQFASDTLAALVLAWVLALGTWAFSRRVLVAGAAGLFAWLSISVPYWNWYMFPMDFTISGLIEVVVGWLLAGAAMAWWLGRGERARG